MIGVIVDKSNCLADKQSMPAKRRTAAKSAPAVSRGRLERLLGYWLRQAQLRVFQDFAAAMDGVTPGQLGAVLLVEANPGMTQSALAAALGIDRSTAVALIDRLQRHGLVRRAPRDGDRRANALELDGGTALLARLLKRLEAHERRIARGLSPGERRQLIALLRRVAPDARPRRRAEGGRR
jgi:DNA-binding MarR family transcriptional regulator